MVPDLDADFRSAPGRTRPPRWGLLADDLTGACDAGVQFARLGFSTVLLLGARGAEKFRPDLVIRSSNSRNDLPRAAGAKVWELGRRFSQESRSLIYKKVDSTLKGNLGAEIQAAMDICKTSLAVVAPAFPAMGRTLEHGWLRGIGGAVVPEVHLPSLLRRQGVANVVHLGQSVFGGGVAELAGRLRSGAGEEPRMVVIDALAQEHLSLIAQAARRLEQPPLLAGSAGLAAELAGLLASAYKKKPAAPLEAKSPAGARPVALFIGSTNPVTLEQVEYLLSHRSASRFALGGSSLRGAQRAFSDGRHLVVTVDRNEDKKRVADFAASLCELGCAGLFLAGGDTAHLICSALGVKSLRLENEIAPCLPWGTILGGPADGLPVATKAGGFGQKQALAAIADFLAGRTQALKE